MIPSAKIQLAPGPPVPRPKQARPDLQFWGGTTIMVVPTSGDSKPAQLLSKIQMKSTI
jgi:hypothetical protein